MAYSITKQPDGDVNLGNLNGELVVLQPAAADYPPGGYAIIDGESVQNGASASTINCDLWRVLFFIPAGTTGGYYLQWIQSTKKVMVMQGQATITPDLEVPAGTDLSAIAFQLLLVGQ